MGLIHNAGNPVNFKIAVILTGLIKTEQVGHAGAASTLHPDPEFLRGIKSFRFHQFPDLKNGALRKCDR